ncbi:PAB-dependent poly(A)-specific ribonuclease subunit 3 [Pestalotiopsis sp. 9143b]|nr:PAB-dependent poly(A)-specific ribonuclease subunit 3 [Pestalotiopsis sp. 9143b]
MDPGDTSAPEAVPASAEGLARSQAADTQDSSPNPPAAMSTIKEDDKTEPGGDEDEEQADAYALEDPMDFPSLSAAAQFATLPKRKQTDRSFAKKQLNVDSPSFTPAQLGTKKSTFSSQTANATPFTPKGAASATPQGISQDGDVGFMNPAAAREFTPQTQNYDLNTTTATNGMNNESSASIYDPYTMAGMNQALSATPYNPYAEDHNPMAAAGASYYPTPGVYTAPVQPLQYHLYAPVGPARSDLQAYQRQSHDFYIPPEMREDLQKKSAATRQVMHSSQLPDVQPYHSLVPLEGLKSGQSSLFGSTVCWVYKATSKKNGHVYCLRRLQGVRVSGKDSTNTPLSKWKRMSNGSIVTPVEVFTSRDFGDTSLIFIHNYHPCSKTLAEHHLTAARFKLAIPETVIWSYICQICNALRTIHDADLAARCIHPTKIILTEKNRIRLSACMILDVLEYDSPRPLAELQHEDLIDLGKLIMSLCLNQNQVHNVQASWQSLQQSTYTDELKELVFWLISPPSIEARDQKHIGYLSQSIAHHLFDSFDAAFHAYDEILSELHKELENGRVARLVMKLGTINERPEFDNDPTWAENGERYTLKLFRDYVFHQVDANNNPVLNMGHMLSCLNKLDAGIDEKVYLTSRDHQTSFVVTYKEVKKQVNNAFQELQKAGQPKPATNNRTAF